MSSQPAGGMGAGFTEGTWKAVEAGEAGEAAGEGNTGCLVLSGVVAFLGGLTGSEKS